MTNPDSNLIDIRYVAVQLKSMLEHHQFDPCNTERGMPLGRRTQLCGLLLDLFRHESCTAEVATVFDDLELRSPDCDFELEISRDFFDDGSDPELLDDPFGMPGMVGHSLDVAKDVPSGELGTVIYFLRYPTGFGVHFVTRAFLKASKCGKETVVSDPWLPANSVLLQDPWKQDLIAYLDSWIRFSADSVSENKSYLATSSHKIDEPEDLVNTKTALRLLGISRDGENGSPIANKTLQSWFRKHSLERAGRNLWRRSDIIHVAKLQGHDFVALIPDKGGKDGK